MSEIRNPPGNPKWRKGQSGNPGGQTKAAVAYRRMVAELISESTEGGKEIVEFAIEVMRGLKDGCEDSKSRRWAADFLAERLWGRAPLVVEVGNTEPAPIPDMSGLSIDELRRLAAGTDGEPPGDVH